MKIVFLSNHAWGTRRQAGFHHFAEACHAIGHEVTFATVGLSFFSRIRHDSRLTTGAPCNRLQEIKPGFYSYLHETFLHPHTLVFPLLNRLSAPLVRRYDRYSFGELEPKICEADVIFYESCSAVCLVKKCRILAPCARHVYLASDVISVMRSLHPEVLRVEREVLPLFDLISIPAPNMAEHFAGFEEKLRIREHGVTRALFDAETRNPYDGKTPIAVFVGTSYFDYFFLEQASAALPGVKFYIIGPLPRKVCRANIVYIPEMPYAETIRYIKFATIGLYARGDGIPDEIMRSLGDSLKMKQYRYCALPVVMPSTVPGNSGNGFFRYDPGCPESIVKAVTAALNAKHDPSWADRCPAWADVARRLLRELEDEAKK